MSEVDTGQGGKIWKSIKIRVNVKEIRLKRIEKTTWLKSLAIIFMEDGWVEESPLIGLGERRVCLSNSQVISLHKNP